MVTRVTLLEDTLDSTDSTTAVDLGASGHRCLCCEAMVSAVDGTDPTLDLVLETSADGTTWTELCSWDQATAVGTYRILPDRTERYIRLSWVVGGTDSPEFTVKVIGYSFDSYCSPAEMASLGLPLEKLQSYNSEHIAKALHAASSRADKAFRAAGFTLPILAWEDWITECVAVIASFSRLSTAGFNIGVDENKTWDLRYKQALKDLDAMGDDDATGTTPDEEEEDDGMGSSFAVASDCRRGWDV